MAGRRESVTLKDVASAADVSIATVSYVLNNTSNAVNAETRAHVLEVAKRMNYRPNRAAKGLKTAHFDTLAIVVEDFRSFFIQQLIDGICQCAEKRGYDVVLMNLRLDSRISRANHYETDEFCEYARRRISNVKQMQVDAMVYIGAFYHDIRDMLENLTLPYAYLYSFSSTDKEHPSVHYDDYQAAYEATRLLLSKGHRRIAHVAGTLSSVPGQARVAGWRRALRDAGVEAIDELLFPAEFDSLLAYEAGLKLLSMENRPTAVFAASDLMAKGIYDACAERKVRIPEQLSVVGFDNMDFSGYLTPRLTTMEMPTWDMGCQVVNMVLDEAHEGRQVRLSCRLIERESVAEMKKGGK